MGAYLQIITPGHPAARAVHVQRASTRWRPTTVTCTGVFTTTTPTDAYRGAGRPEATFAIERIIDELAAELGIDPMELRRRNWIKHEEFPYTTISGLTYDSGNYEAATDRAMELFDYDGLRAEQAARRAANDPVQLGIGISTFTEMCGLAPSRVLGALRYAAGGWEHCTIRILPTGKVELVTGTSPHGQGHETAWSQIASDSLGIPVDDIEVIHGDTGRSPYGMDTYGSRSLAVGGMAILRAAEAVVEKARVIAGAPARGQPGRPRVRGRRPSRCKGDPDSAKTIQAIAWEAFTAHDLPDGTDPNLFGESTVDPQTFSFPHGTHLCAVEVDTETGHDEDPQVRRGGRRRRAGQPDDRRGPGPRRRHPGHRAGAVGEARAYDEDGNLVTGVARRLPAADRGRRAVLRPPTAP